MASFGATAVVVREGEVLLIKRKDLEVWALPGGAIEDGESFAQAAVREVREETGVEIELTHLVGIYSRPRWRYGGDHGVVFAARPLSDALVAQPEEVIELGYFDPGALPQPLLWWARARIEDALAGVVGVVRHQDGVWPFDPGDNGLQRLRQSGKSPAEFYLEHFSKPGPLGDGVELDGVRK